MSWRDIGWIVTLLFTIVAHAQTLDNRALNGKYFFRQIWLASDTSGNVTDGRSLLGAISFDGNGNYTFTGQQAHGTAAPAAATGPGTYSVDPGGIVSLTDPLGNGQTLNGRFSQSGLVAASTEAANNAFELLAAIPAPTSASNASLTGAFWAATLEFPRASAKSVRNTIFHLQADGQGNLGSIAVNGHEADLSGGGPLSQNIANATYALSADGSGTATFGNSASLLGGNRTVYISADGNLLLGGSPGGIDLMIGVKASSGVSNATWTGRFWRAGLRLDNQGMISYTGSVFANAQGTLTEYRRQVASGYGSIDYTGALAYQLNADGSGTSGLRQAALGSGGHAFLLSSVNSADSAAFEIDFGLTMPGVSGSGVFLNPQGILNAASSAPAGNPIAPGEYLAIYGTGLANSSQSASPPYPLSVAGVSVTINNQSAPIYFVSPGQINLLVPYGTSGPRATLVITNNGAKSNSVTVPVATTAPGVFSQDQSGTGLAAMLHADYSLVSVAHPAHPGETIQVFLTGLGAVNPMVQDGAVPGASQAVTPLAVLIGGDQAATTYAGLAPGFPGLYQINVAIPTDITTTGLFPLAVATPNATHDQTDVPISAQ